MLPVASHRERGMGMKRRTSSAFIERARAACIAAAGLALVVAVAGCNEERKQECDRFIAAMGPMQSGTPGSDAVDKVQSDVAALKFQDEPLGVYATNYKTTLTVLSNTLKLKETAGADGPPDGTNDVIKAKSKEARTDFDDISRYCSN
jgi:hypothetical protein